MPKSPNPIFMGSCFVCGKMCFTKHSIADRHKVRCSACGLLKEGPIHKEFENGSSITIRKLGDERNKEFDKRLEGET